jgi:hypothetical protein
MNARIGSFGANHHLMIFTMVLNHINSPIFIEIMWGACSFANGIEKKGVLSTNGECTFPFDLRVDKILFYSS